MVCRTPEENAEVVTICDHTSPAYDDICRAPSFSSWPRRMINQNPPVPQRHIEQAILLIRGHRVMLSTDLAALYRVEPKMLVRAVKRNIERFPEDFMFQLSPEEWSFLKSQVAISSWGGGSKVTICDLEARRERQAPALRIHRAVTLQARQ